MQKVLMVIIAVMGFAALFTSDRWQTTQWESRRALELEATLQLCRTRMENSILTRFDAIGSLASLFIIHPDTTPEEFSHFASLLLRFHPPIRALQYADDNTRVTYVYPPKGNEVPIKSPITLLEDTLRGPFVEKAIQTKKAILQGPFELRQGGTGIVLRVPIFKGDQFIGLAIGVYDLPVLIAEALEGVRLDQVNLSLKDRQGTGFWNSGKPVQGGLSSPLTVANTVWELGINWSAKLSRPLLARLLIWLLGAGFILLSLYALRFFWKHEQQLEVLAAKRTDELSQANLALKASEAKYRSILDSAASVIFIKDLDGKYIYINKKYEESHGITDQKIQGFTDRDIFPREMADQFRQNDLAVIQSGKPIDFEEKVIRYNRAHTVIVTKFPLYDNQKRPYALCGISTDITDRKQMESELRDREARFKAVFEHSPFAIALVSTDGRPLLINPAFSSIMGYTEDELKEMDFSQYTYPNDLKKEMPLFRELSEGKRDAYHIVKRNIQKNGLIVWLSAHMAAIKDEQGQLKYFIAIGEDITEKKKMETELLQAHKMEAIGTLAGGIAHDFNNVLTSIIGFTELALDDTQKGTELEENLREVFSAGLRAKDLVLQILTFARQSEEKVKPTRVDLIAYEVLKLIRSSIPTTIEIKSHIDSTSLVMGNPSQIHQILMNLCTNAYHAMDDTGGILDVSLKDIVLDNDTRHIKGNLPSGDYIEIRVADTGGGISPDIIGSVFEPYFTTKGPGEGSGMGLAVVHGIVKSHSGAITAESQSGKGSIFTVYLPVTRKHTIQPSYEPEDLPPGDERILLVDDEASIIKMVSRNLERLGYAVTSRTSSIEALALFRSTPDDFDLVITDMTMPELTGDMLATEMMILRPEIPIILCTGYSNKISDASAKALGIKAFAYKPIVKKDLANTVRKVLDMAKG